jgi:hypothetical protein
VLPFSKYCTNHVISDQEQYLFEQCESKDDESGRCPFPATLSQVHCLQHTMLDPSKSQRLMSCIEVAKKAKLARKRKIEHLKTEKKEKDEKKEIVHHNTRRASKNREDSLTSPDMEKTQKIFILEGHKTVKNVLDSQIQIECNKVIGPKKYETETSLDGQTRLGDNLPALEKQTSEIPKVKPNIVNDLSSSVIRN